MNLNTSAKQTKTDLNDSTKQNHVDLNAITLEKNEKPLIIDTPNNQSSNYYQKLDSSLNYIFKSFKVIL
jgi:hypothetical protein